MAADQYLGEFEHLVMLAVVRLGKEAYGVTIRQELILRARRPVSFGALYATLRRLEKKEYLASRLGDPESVPGGRAKKYFRVRQQGMAALKASQQRLARMSADLDDILAGGEESL